MASIWSLLFESIATRRHFVEKSYGDAGVLELVVSLSSIHTPGGLNHPAKVISPRCCINICNDGLLSPIIRPMAVGVWPGCGECMYAIVILLFCILFSFF